MRHLIVCCDGTWNRADQVHDGVPTPTNVRLFHNALDTVDHEGNSQRARYFSGVGADGSLLSRAVEGGTGHGLSRNIMNAYAWLSSEFRTDDKITAIGFSRGAYTARSLVAMMTTCGLLRFAPDSEPGASWTDVQKVFHDGYVPGPDKRSPTWADDLAFHDGFEPPAGADSKEGGPWSGHPTGASTTRACPARPVPGQQEHDRRSGGDHGRTQRRRRSYGFRGPSRASTAAPGCSGGWARKWSKTATPTISQSH